MKKLDFIGQTCTFIPNKMFKKILNNLSKIKTPDFNYFED